MAFDPKLREQAHAAFRFVVAIGGQDQAAFTDCTLPTIEWEVEEVREGGLNSYVHQLPGRRKAARITLKNGVGKSDLLQWYLETMRGTFSRKAVTVKLVTFDKGAPKVIQTWNIANAFPARWTGPDLKADSNTVAIQSLELAGGEITVT